MFEIFLFINPIGIYCYDLEKMVQETVDKLGVIATYHFIPIANAGTVQDDVIRRRQNEQKLSNVSNCILTANEALIDYHAIKLTYGNKKARSFLFKLQEKLHKDNSCYSITLLKKITQDINIDYCTMQSMRCTEYIKDSIEQDQDLTNQWQISKTPTTVIFDENEVDDSGKLFEGVVDQNELTELLQTSEKPHYSKNKCSDILTTNHLRLI